MKRVSVLLSLFWVFTVVSRVGAIAVDDYDIAEVSPTNVGYNLELDFVYNYKVSTAVAVDHYWILTAAHVGDDGGTGDLVIDGKTYHQQEVVLHDSADLALVRYDEPLPGHYLLLTGDIYHEEGGYFGSKVWHELLMSGYGYAGTLSDDSFPNEVSLEIPLA